MYNNPQEFSTIAERASANNEHMKLIANEEGYLFLVFHTIEGHLIEYRPYDTYRSAWHSYRTLGNG